MSTPKITIIMASAAQTNPNMPPKQWMLNMALPERENTKITSMFLLDGNLEIFATDLVDTAGQATKGFHQTIMPPSVHVLMAAGPLAAWEEELRELADIPEEVEEVLDIGGSVWRLHHPMPGDETTKIVRMIVVDNNMVEIYVRPNPENHFAQVGLAMKMILMPYAVSQVIAVAPYDKMLLVAREIAEEAAAQESGEDLDDDEEEDEDSIDLASSTLPPNSKLPNGAAPTEPTST